VAVARQGARDPPRHAVTGDAGGRGGRQVEHHDVGCPELAERVDQDSGLELGAEVSIERGFTHDREDVLELIKRVLVEPARLRMLFNAIEPELFRYPAIDPPTLRRKLDERLAA
jgi:hypothetical protein